jgi:hypothetical protein
MNRGRGRRGNQTRNPVPEPGAQALRAVRELKRSLHGHKNELRGMAPSEVTKRPWYPLVVNTVIASAAVETFYSPADIVNILSAQLGLSSQTKTVVNVKIQRVDVWAMATGASSDRPAVSLDVSSLVPGIGDPVGSTSEIFYGIIKKLSDEGNLSESAKVSYTWPAHMADVPLNSNVVFTVVATSGNVPNVQVRFHLLWSTTDIAAPV